MSEISREDLVAFTEAHAKLAVALEKITDRMSDIASNQGKILDKLGNGMAHDISDGVNEHYNEVHKETVSTLSRVEASQVIIKQMLSEKLPEAVKSTFDNSTIAKDIGHVKWFIGILGLLIVIGTTIFRSIDNRNIMSNYSQINNTQIQVLAHLLQDHMDKEKGVTNDGKS